MKLLGIRPIFYTDDLDGTIEFYTEILRFTLADRNDDWGWASLFKDTVEVMLARPNAHVTFDKAQFTGSMYFNTDDADALWSELKDKTKICYEIDSFDWGMREFAIYDNNGYVLQFGQEIKNGKS